MFKLNNNNEMLTRIVTWETEDNRGNTIYFGDRDHAAALYAIEKGLSLFKVVTEVYNTYDKVNRYHENPYHVLPKQLADVARAMRVAQMRRNTPSVK